MSVPCGIIILHTEKRTLRKPHMKTTVLGIDKADEPTDLETVAMTIDESSVQHLMSTMTNLYSDPVLAVIREYSSNALDSHIRAGVTQPIKVTLPNEHNLNFVVEDFGIGMSKDDIANIYSRYGLSTKNGTNSEIGAFGLGCKSALAIADRFDLVARKDGIETVAFIQKNNKGVGVVHFVSETATDQSNGVKVTIPIHPIQVSRFQSSAENVFDTWSLGTVLINGQPNKAVQYGADWVEISPAGEPIAWVKLEKSGYFRTYRSYSNLFSNTTFIIGGIAYTIDRKTRSEFPFDTDSYKRLSEIVDNNKLIVNLPIGSVDLTPSREAIMITEKTVKTINSIISDVAENIRATVLDYIQSLDITEAVKVYATNFNLFADEIDFTAQPYTSRAGMRTRRPEFYGVTYHGEEIPTWVDVTDKKYYELNSQDGRALGTPEMAARVYTINAIIRDEYSNGNCNNIIVVAKAPLTEVTVDAFRKNLRDYSKAKFNTTNINAVITDDTEISKWVDSVYTQVDFDSFLDTARKYRSAKKSEAQTGSKRSAVAYAMATLNSGDINYGDIVKITADDISNGGKNVIFVSADKDRMVNLSDPWTAVTDTMRLDRATAISTTSFQDFARLAFGSDKQIVFLNKGKSIEAFTRKFPNAVSYEQAIINSVDEVNKSGELDVLAGVVSGIYNTQENNSVAGFSTNFMSVSDSLHKYDLIKNLTDKKTRTVFNTMLSTGKLTAIARLLADVKMDKSKALVALYENAKAVNYGGRYSLINRLELSRYYRIMELSESETQQIVAFINAC